jgi:hypothetical protein
MFAPYHHDDENHIDSLKKKQYGAAYAHIFGQILPKVPLSLLPILHFTMTN